MNEFTYYNSNQLNTDVDCYLDLFESLFWIFIARRERAFFLNFSDLIINFHEESERAETFNSSFVPRFLESILTIKF